MLFLGASLSGCQVSPAPAMAVEAILRFVQMAGLAKKQKRNNLLRFELTERNFYRESNSFGFARYSKKEGMGYLFSEGVLDEGSSILFSVNAFLCSVGKAGLFTAINAVEGLACNELK